MLSFIVNFGLYQGVESVVLGREVGVVPIVVPTDLGLIVVLWNSSRTLDFRPGGYDCLFGANAGVLDVV